MRLLKLNGLQKKLLQKRRLQMRLLKFKELQIKLLVIKLQRRRQRLWMIFLKLRKKLLIKPD